VDIYHPDCDLDYLYNRFQTLAQSLMPGRNHPPGMDSRFFGRQSLYTPEDMDRVFDDARNSMRGFGFDVGRFGDKNTDLNTPTRPPASPVSAPPVGNPLHGVVDASLVTVLKSRGISFDKEPFYIDITGKVIGQEQVLRVLTELLAIHVCKTSPNRPLTALLAGPTGTGKTLTAEQVAEQLTKYTGIEWGYIRIDMNQLTEKTSVSRLLGADPNYVGYDDPLLFEPLMKNKYQVILFDEMEKGHPAVLQVLMNAMGNGRLESNKPIEGQREFDFRHCVMLFTSNLPLSVENLDDMTQSDITRACREQLTKPVKGRSAMPPEIAARFTEILLYRSLSDADKVEILGLTIMRTAEQYSLKVRSIDPAFLQDIVDKLTLNNGARDAVCEIERILGDPLAAFNNSHDGITDIALSGTSDQVIIKPYAG